jgi:hypothetical protein
MTVLGTTWKGALYFLGHTIISGNTRSFDLNPATSQSIMPYLANLVHLKPVTALCCLIFICIESVSAKTCPATPADLPVGSAMWSPNGNPRWRLLTGDKSSYPCLPPKQWGSLILGSKEFFRFDCNPLSITITITKCPPMGKELCELIGNASYVLVDRNLEEFSLQGMPSFDLYKPSSKVRECSSTHVMHYHELWLFRAGAKHLALIKTTELIAVSVKQPFL